MSGFFDNFLLKQRCGFRKGYSTQNCLSNLLEKWKNSVIQEKLFAVLLTELSKAFDYLGNEFIPAKSPGFVGSLAI